MPEKIGPEFDNGGEKPKTPETEKKEWNKYRIEVDVFLEPSEARETMKGFADALDLLSKEATKAEADGDKSRNEMLQNEIKGLEKIFGEFKVGLDNNEERKRLAAEISKYNKLGHSEFPITEKGALGEYTYNATIFGIAGSGKHSRYGEGGWYVGELPDKRFAGRVEPLHVPDDGNRETRKRYYESKNFTPEIIEAIEAAISRAEKAIKGEGEED